ncbi:MAG: hypothetical protein E7270_08945 [Lachnospiraceae bacterium]|nr:hypothetical protein [Lachnospiraceae bacterium]MBQ4068098.1 hypothetical protein [Lachnospiraceae bacterium]
MRKLLTNNIGYKLISILSAFVLWLIVVNISDPTVTRTITGIPVVKVDEDVLTEQGKVFVVSQGSSATISVKGPRSLVDKLDEDDFIAEAPFGEMTNQNAVPIYVSHKNSKYDKSIEIIQKTRTMVLSIEDIKTKYLDIVVNFIGEPASGYSVGHTKLSKTFVKVSAPESIIDRIENAYVDVDVTKLKGNMESQVVIKYSDSQGEIVELDEDSKVTAETVVVNVVIYQMKEVPLSVSVAGTAANGYEYTGVELSSDTIFIEGENAYQIDSIVLPNDLVDISGARENVEVEVDISQYLPAGTRLVNDDSKMIKITAMVEGYITESYRLPVENIELRNLDDKYIAEFVDDDAEMSLVALNETHDAINISQMLGYIDLSGAKAGTREYNVVLELPEGVSLNGNVMVVLKISKIEETKEETKEEATTKNEETTEADEETTE